VGQQGCSLGGRSGCLPTTLKTRCLCSLLAGTESAFHEQRSELYNKMEADFNTKGVVQPVTSVILRFHFLRQFLSLQHPCHPSLRSRRQGRP